MQETVTPEMIRSVYSRAQEPRALLLTLQADDIDDLFFTDWPEGLVSNGVTFEYFPFTFKWPGASSDEQATGAKIEIFNRDRRVTEAIRAATGKPRMTVQLVRIATPDTVEMAVNGAMLEDVEGDETTLSGTLAVRSFKTEPSCMARYTLARTPGLF